MAFLSRRAVSAHIMKFINVVPRVRFMSGSSESDDDGGDRGDGSGDHHLPPPFPLDDLDDAAAVTAEEEYTDDLDDDAAVTTEEEYTDNQDDDAAVTTEEEDWDGSGDHRLPPPPFTTWEEYEDWEDDLWAQRLEKQLVGYDVECGKWLNEMQELLRELVEKKINTKNGPEAKEAEKRLKDLEISSGKRSDSGDFLIPQLRAMEEKLSVLYKQGGTEELTAEEIDAEMTVIKVALLGQLLKAMPYNRGFPVRHLTEAEAEKLALARTEEVEREWEKGGGQAVEVMHFCFFACSIKIL